MTVDLDNLYLDFASKKDRNWTNEAICDNNENFTNKVW